MLLCNVIYKYIITLKKNCQTYFNFFLIGNNFSVIIALIFYFLTIFFLLICASKNKIKTKPFPKLKMNKNGIFFTSKFKHKVKIENLKVMLLDDCVYLKNDNTFIIIKNVFSAFKLNNYLYFNAMGEVKIIFKTEEFFRYFNLVIKSNKFNLNKLKQEALKDILNNLTNIKNSKILNKYINFIKNVLKIDINNKKIEIKPNIYNLPFTVFYKINNKVTRVVVQERIWQKLSFMIQ